MFYLIHLILIFNLIQNVLMADQKMLPIPMAQFPTLVTCHLEHGKPTSGSGHRFW